MLTGYGSTFKPGQLFDPETFSADQAKGLVNKPGQSLSQTNTSDQLKGVITPDSLTKTEPFPLVSPTIPTPYDVTGLPDFTPLEATPQEEQQSEITSNLGGLYKSLIGQSAYKNKAEKEFGVDIAAANINDLGAQLTRIKNEANAIYVEEQSRAHKGTILTAGLEADQNQKLRDNAVEALGVSSLLAASQGQLLNAQALADRAVSEKYDPILEQIAANQANLQLIINDPATKLADMNRALEQQAIQDKKAEEAAEAKQTEADIWKVANDAATNGVAFRPTAQYPTLASTLDAISKAPTREDALSIAVKTGLNVNIQERQLSQQQLNDQRNYNLNVAEFNLRKWTANQGDGNGTGSPANPDAILSPADAKAWGVPLGSTYADALRLSQLPNDNEKLGFQDKLLEVDNALKHKGLDSRVGPNTIARTFYAAKDQYGAGQDFAGTVKQMTDELTLDKLIEVKGQGGTFGSLSDGERIVLANAATKINGWEIKDDEGKGTGEWDINEKSFKTELEKIRTIIVRRYIAAGGDAGITQDEEKELMNEFDSSGFNAANY